MLSKQVSISAESSLIAAAADFRSDRVPISLSHVAGAFHNF